jgi:hypothetical protein
LLALSIALLSAAAVAPGAGAPAELRVMIDKVGYGGLQVSFSATIEAIRAADAHVVGPQEPDGNTALIAAAAGYPYVDLRPRIISHYRLFDPKLGDLTETGQAAYTFAGLDGNAAHIWVMVRPGRVVAVATLREAVALIAGMALRPCTGAIFLPILTRNVGIWAVGVAGPCAKGLGTATVTAGVALLTLWAREGALQTLAGGRIARALPLAEVSVGLLIAGAAAALLAGSL